MKQIILAMTAVLALVALTSVAYAAMATDRIDIQSGGATKAILTYDEATGSFVIKGPNITSTAFKLSATDKFVFGSDTATCDVRVCIDDDTRLTGVLQVGMKDVFHEAAIDPRGAIQQGRALIAPEPHSIQRYFRGDETTIENEKARFGLNAEDNPCFSTGADDTFEFCMDDDGVTLPGGARIYVEGGALKASLGGVVTTLVAP